MKPQPRVTIYRNYRFLDKDSIIDALRTVIKDENHLTDNRAAAITGVAATTFFNWFSGPTRCPQNASVTQAAAALGYVRRDEIDSRGQVHVGFVRARQLDYDREITKQADWILKQNRPKKRKNGASR